MSDWKKIEDGFEYTFGPFTIGKLLQKRWGLWLHINSTFHKIGNFTSVTQAEAFVNSYINDKPLLKPPEDKDGV